MAFYKIKFKHFQGPSDTDSRSKGLSRTMSVFKEFPGLENLEKN